MPRPSDEEIQSIIHMVTGRRPRYERRGECLRCGQCCANEECEHFTPATEEEPASCAIWGEPDRAVKCTEFPLFPPVVFKGCGYYFADKAVKSDEEERILGYKEI